MFRRLIVDCFEFPRVRLRRMSWAGVIAHISEIARSPRVNGLPGASAVRAVRPLALEFTLGEIARAFAKEGIACLLLKGPAFAVWLYDKPAERPYRDLDLLIAPGSLVAARRRLQALGFACVLPGTNPHEQNSHHERWARRETLPAIVELHWTLFWVSAPPALVWQRLSEDAGEIEVASVRVATLSEVGRAMLVALHAAQHGARIAVPMRDLRLALANVDFGTWEAAAALAEELGASEGFAAGLRLGPTGDELAARLGLAGESSRLTRLTASTPPPLAVGLERLIATRGIRPKLRLLRRELAPSRQFMRAAYPVARRGRRGLALAYVVRPWWLAAHLPRGLGAWLQVAVAQLTRPDAGCGH